MTRHLWTDAEVEILRLEYAETPTLDLAQRFGLPLNKVYAKAAKLGLLKSSEYLRAQNHKRLRNGEAGRATRFAAGQAPWNKGKRFPHNSSGKFAQGNRPHTWKPIGTYRLTKDGLLQLKVADVPGPTHLRWRCVHELAWIAAHGPVPAGHVVVFKPGQMTAVLDEITADRTELVSRADLMRRNSVHRHGPELAQLSQLKGAIHRQINQRKKEVA